jgi:hypothetical protein
MTDRPATSAVPTIHDPRGGPPRLRADLHLGTVWDLPEWSQGPRSQGAELYRAIAAAGFEGVQGGDPAACAEAGLACTTFGVARTTDALDDQVRLWRDLGFEAATLHVGTGLEDRDAAVSMLADVVAISSDLGFPLYVETHRATITQDIWRTVDLVEAVPELRFNGDFSHWYTGLEMPYGDFEAKLEFARPVFERTRFLHGRIGDPGCIQVDVGDDPADEPPSVAHFRSMWTRAMQGFLATAVDGDMLPFVPELLPAGIHYARTIPDGDASPAADGRRPHREEGDRWTQALRLVAIACECFAEAASEGSAGPRTVDDDATDGQGSER